MINKWWFHVEMLENWAMGLYAPKFSREKKHLVCVDVTLSLHFDINKTGDMLLLI